MLITRYTTPGKLDVAPYGTIYNVIEEDGSTSRWIQLNQITESHAYWIPIGKLLEESFDKYFDAEEFVALLIFLNQRKDVDAINNLGKYLSQVII